jgi:hypothetical protein
MAWSFERIKNEWLGDAVVRHSPAELVRLCQTHRQGCFGNRSCRSTGEAIHKHFTYVANPGFGTARGWWFDPPTVEHSAGETWSVGMKQSHLMW